jgi:hypothetical protein
MEIMMEAYPTLSKEELLHSDCHQKMTADLLWWRKALGHIYDGQNIREYTPTYDNDLPNLLAQLYSKNPVVRILQDAVKDKQLTMQFLEHLLEARGGGGDLTKQQPVREQEMLEYVDAFQSSALYLSLEVCGMHDNTADVVMQIGIGLVTASIVQKWRVSHFSRID